MPKHSLEQAIKALNKKKDVQVEGTDIYIRNESTEVGNKSWGRIDYLRKQHNMLVFVVDRLPKECKMKGQVFNIIRRLAE